jgi:hypothetical protein
MPNAIAAIPDLVKQLYEVVTELTNRFPGRRFTPDGHLVGSIGEVIAQHRYGLDLLETGAPTHDAIAKDGRSVQIKITQGKSVGLRAEPDYLIVLNLSPSGDAIEIYNGPGPQVWQCCGKMQKNGQRQIRLTKLSGLMKDVDPDQKIHSVTK